MDLDGCLVSIQNIPSWSQNVALFIVVVLLLIVKMLNLLKLVENLRILDNLKIFSLFLRLKHVRLVLIRSFADVSSFFKFD